MKQLYRFLLKVLVEEPVGIGPSGRVEPREE